MPVPNFLVVGPPRTGTTWLYNMLKQIPDVYVPKKKQIHFFDKYYSMGMEWYQSNFSMASSKDIVGELTPDYVTNPEALSRIANDLPGVKVVLIFRDPVDRALSHYRVRSRLGVYEGKSFSEVFEKDDYLLKNSLYGVHMSHLIDKFPVQDILVINYKYISNSPGRVIEAVQEFLGSGRVDIPIAILNKEYGKSLSPSKFYALDMSMVYLVSKLKWTRRFMQSLKIEDLFVLMYRMLRHANTNNASSGEYAVSSSSRKIIERDCEFFFKYIDEFGIKYIG